MQDFEATVGCTDDVALVAAVGHGAAERPKALAQLLAAWKGRHPVRHPARCRTPRWWPRSVQVRGTGGARHSTSSSRRRLLRQERAAGAIAVDRRGRRRVTGPQSIKSGRTDGSPAPGSRNACVAQKGKHRHVGRTDSCMVVGDRQCRAALHSASGKPSPFRAAERLHRALGWQMLSRGDRLAARRIHAGGCLLPEDQGLQRSHLQPNRLFGIAGEIAGEIEQRLAAEGHALSNTSTHRMEPDVPC